MTEQPQTFRARIDRSTKRVTLPVSADREYEFSIKGVWRTDDHPDGTAVELRAVTRRYASHSFHHLTRDTSFRLPFKTLQAEITVLEAVPSTRLEVTVSPVIDTPTPPERPKGPQRGPVGTWDYKLMPPKERAHGHA